MGTMNEVFPRCWARFGYGSQRARGKSFLPPGLKPLQRRAPALAMLIREAFFARALDAASGAGGEYIDGGK
jgi:hypothetical protein